MPRHNRPTPAEFLYRSACLSPPSPGDGGEEAAFRDCQYEGIYSFIADERSKVVVIGGPSGELKPMFKTVAPESSPNHQQKTSLSDRLPIPIRTPIRLHRSTEETISNQLTFRNPLYPLDAAIGAFVVCNSRWETFRRNLHNVEKNSTYPPPVASAVPARASPARAAGDRTIGSEESLKRLVSFDVITSRRCLRELLRFLFPNTTPYNTPFAIDVDLVGNTLLFTSKAPAKTTSAGCGRDFEHKATTIATVSTGEGKREELTTSFVLHSFHFCQQMRILITAEVDAVDPGFNLLPKQEASSSSSIDCGGEYCSYKEQDIG
ncbi:transcription factor btf3, putative, partial [Eimeria acervulina]